MSKFISPLSPTQILYKQSGLTIPTFNDVMDSYERSEEERWKPLQEYVSNPENQVSSQLANFGVYGPDVNAIAAGIQGIKDGEDSSKISSSLSDDVSSNMSDDDVWSKLYKLLTERDANYNATVSEENEKYRLWTALMDQRAMNFEEHMASTAYQRTFADMKAAGLNPYAYMLGGGSPQVSNANGFSSSTSFQIGKRSSAFENVLDYYKAYVNHQVSTAYNGILSSNNKNTTSTSAAIGSLQALASLMPVFLAMFA